MTVRLRVALFSFAWATSIIAAVVAGRLTAETLHAPILEFGMVVFMAASGLAMWALLLLRRRDRRRHEHGTREIMREIERRTREDR